MVRIEYFVEELLITQQNKLIAKNMNYFLSLNLMIFLYPGINTFSLWKASILWMPVFILQ